VTVNDIGGATAAATVAAAAVVSTPPPTTISPVPSLRSRPRHPLAPRHLRSQSCRRVRRCWYPPVGGSSDADRRRVLGPGRGPGTVAPRRRP
jgi:hypothetical protein